LRKIKRRPHQNATSKGRYFYQDAFSGHFRIPLELASRMVTMIAQEGVLSMTDLLSYLLPYPAVFVSSRFSVM
jgi:hypothetical protein